MKEAIAKNLILEACVNKQEELISNYKHRVDVIKADAFDHSHSPSQSEDRTAGKVELLRVYENELAVVRVEMDFLKSLNAAVSNTRVEPGAVVITNSLNFFIGVSSEKVEVEGKAIYGISTKAPIYSAMRGLQSGDTFTFNETTYRIEAVY